MNIILFRLGDVPEDEASDIRNLLDENNIDYFETAPRMFGLSPPAIWLRNRGQLESARALIEAYQTQRFKLKRAEYEAASKEGSAPSLLTKCANDPLRFLLYVAIVGVIMFFTIMPFFWIT